jgi:hypothetical protein
MSKRKRIIISLTLAEAKALLTCAGDGAEGITTDESATRSYLSGGKGIAAYERAEKKLSDAIIAYKVQGI